jgi:homocysteine S-methyltransferase
VLDAEYLANEVPGVHVPSEMLDRMRRAPDLNAAANEGVAISAEIARTLRQSVQGVNVIPPLGRFDLGLALLDALG